MSLGLAGLGCGDENGLAPGYKHKELGKWMKKTKKQRNGGNFMRLNQEDSDEEAAKSLNGHKNGNGVPNHLNDSDLD